MQALFSVFRRPAPPTTFAERRRSSATAASVASVAYSDTSPRHLNQPNTAPSAPPKSNGKVAIPPPPRSRQVSPKQSVEISSASNGVGSAARDVVQGVPMYVAVYACEQQQQSKRTWSMALHLAAAHDAEEVVKYSYRYEGATNGEAYVTWTNATELIDLASEKDLVARVVIGHVRTTGDDPPFDTSNSNHTAVRIGILFNSLPASETPRSASCTETQLVRAWLVKAITTLRTKGLLIETPSSITTANITSSTTKTTDTTASTAKPTNPPVTRPDLISRPTDNWNDLPADFLSPDAPPGGSHRRKMRNSTPRITPKSSSGQLGEVGTTAPSKAQVAGADGSAKPEVEVEEAHEAKSVEAMLDRAEEWAEKIQEQKLANGVGCGDDGEGRSRVRTLDVRSGLELEG